MPLLRCRQEGVETAVMKMTADFTTSLQHRFLMPHLQIGKLRFREGERLVEASWGEERLQTFNWNRS